MVRDVLARRVPMVLRQEIYATASIAGGVVFVGLEALAAPLAVSIATGLVVTLGLRLSAIHWHLSLPVFAWVVVQPPPTPRELKDDGQEKELPRGRPKTRVKLIPPGRTRRRRKPK